MKTRREIELYIHIPFCVRKCNYCDFLSYTASDKLKEDYINALCSEIAYKGAKLSECTVTSIYIGGGTPSTLLTKLIVRIMDTANDTFTIDDDAEITIECNPGTVTKEALGVYKTIGINRLSFGLQSSQDSELKLLGRIHDYKSFLTSLDSALRLGFNNVNVDIMYGLPGQTVSSLKKTFSDVVKFGLKHLSVYSLIIEENTLFYDKYNEDYITRCKGGMPSFLPDEDTLCEMTDFTYAYLNSRGYNQYEISNYAKKGFECKHNIGYWKRKEYIGFGIGAASLYNETRYRNITDIDKYIGNWSVSNPVNEYEEEDKLSSEECMAEFMILGLRMNAGVGYEEFYSTFNRSLGDVYREEIDTLTAQGLVVNDGNFIKPTRKGFELQNIIAREFV